jgi:hypothetical protein
MDARRDQSRALDLIPRLRSLDATDLAAARLSVANGLEQQSRSAIAGFIGLAERWSAEFFFVYVPQFLRRAIAVNHWPTETCANCVACRCSTFARPAG